MACNQCYPTDFKNSYTNYKTNGIFPNSNNEFFSALHVWARLKHQFETSVECISAGQSYLCYIFYEIAYYNFLDYILEKTMIPNLKYVIKISIQKMNAYSYI